MQVLENYEHRLVETFAQNDPFDRIDDSPFASLSLLFCKIEQAALYFKWFAVGESEKAKKRRYGVFQGAVQREDLGVDLLASLALVV
ncbi:MAG TPA: hypothetical protein VNQ15_06340, partial [Verrucomicrobiae bacterium]|nr:hypothetical protein [Verrucomicrobiae bacterium]